MLQTAFFSLFILILTSCGQYKTSVAIFKGSSISQGRISAITTSTTYPLTLSISGLIKGDSIYLVVGANAECKDGSFSDYYFSSDGENLENWSPPNLKTSHFRLLVLNKSERICTQEFSIDLNSEFSIRSKDRVFIPAEFLEDGTKESGGAIASKPMVTPTFNESAFEQIGTKRTPVSFSPPTFDPVSSTISVPSPNVNLSSGPAFTCAVQINGTVKCWGHNESGQLGRATADIFSAVPTEVPNLEDVVSLSSGTYHVCALKSNGDVWCWGLNDSGQLGIGSTGLSTPPTKVGISSVVSLATGKGHTCALKNNGAVYCWGNNGEGQLGTGDSFNYSSPVLTLADGVVVAISAGTYHTCALQSDGLFKCWGSNKYGQLGNPSAGNFSNVPVDVSDINSGVVALSLGHQHSCVLKDDGSLLCWGDNTYLQLGNGSPAGISNRPFQIDASKIGNIRAISAGGNQNCALNMEKQIFCWGSPLFTEPTLIEGEFSAIATGFNHSCAQKNDGSIWCWGENGKGQLGIGAPSNPILAPPMRAFVPHEKFLGEVSTPTNLTTLSAGAYHACAVQINGAVKCWGENSYGQLGTGDKLDSISPQLVSIPVQVKGIEAGLNTTCALSEEGGIWCWGDNSSGQVGNGTLDSAKLPSEVKRFNTDFPAVSVSVGFNSACALTKSGEIYCWGSNSFGQLGLGDFVDRAAPELVPGLSGMVSLSVGANFACATHYSGDLYCWGNNGDGYFLGLPITKLPTPSKISQPEVRPLVSAGYDHICANKLDFSSFSCWGSIAYGQTGSGRSEPNTEAFNVMGKATQLSAGIYHTCAIGEGEQVWCWGANDSGQLGVGTYDSTQTPARVKSAESFTEVTTGKGFSCGKTTKKEIYCWGSLSSSSVPVFLDGPKTMTTGSIVTAPSFKNMSAGRYHTCAISKEGEVWCWGNNKGGQLGDGSLEPSTHPVIVKDLSQVLSLSTGAFHSCALRENGEVWCWGHNPNGELGTGEDGKDSYVPVAVADLKEVVALDSAPYHTCALVKDGSVWCWGLNSKHQWGQGIDKSLTPFKIDAVSGIIGISTSSTHTCALKNDHTVSCWGANDQGQLGHGTTSDLETPNTIKDFSDVVDISVGDGFTIALKKDGGIWSWGAGGETVPKLWETMSDVVSIETGSNHLCLPKTDGSVWCAGSNEKKQLGDPKLLLSTDLINVRGLEGIENLAVGQNHNCASNSKGEILCWGDNSGNQIAGTPLLRPVLETLGPGIEAVAASDNHACFLMSDKTVRCSGTPSMLGLGDSLAQSFYTFAEATVIPELNHVREINADPASTCALTDDGSMYCWGDNSVGQFGEPTPTSSLVPTQVPMPPGEQFEKLYSGSGNRCALTTSQKVFCWGGNGYGQIGLDPASTPFSAIPRDMGLENIIHIMITTTSVCAQKADLSVFCWGGNFAFTPAPFEKLSGFEKITAMAHNACGLKSNSLYCVGRNDFGQLGIDPSKLSESPDMIDTGISGVDLILPSPKKDTVCFVKNSALYCIGEDFGSTPVALGVGNVKDGLLQANMIHTIIDDDKKLVIYKMVKTLDPSDTTLLSYPEPQLIR